MNPILFPLSSLALAISTWSSILYKLPDEFFAWSIKSPTLNTVLSIIASGWERYAPDFGNISVKSALSEVLKATLLSTGITVVVAPLDTLPLNWTLSLSESWTSIKSPGLNICPPMPEVKVTTSSSSCSVSKWNLPTAQR